MDSFCLSPSAGVGAGAGAGPGRRGVERCGCDTEAAPTRPPLLDLSFPRWRWQSWRSVEAAESVSGPPGCRWGADLD